MDKRELKQLKKTLDENLSCYVLITCAEPTATGQIPVEMTYQGAEPLISYLLQDAQMHMEQEEEEELKCCEKISSMRFVE